MLFLVRIRFELFSQLIPNFVLFFVRSCNNVFLISLQLNDKTEFYRFSIFGNTLFSILVNLDECSSERADFRPSEIRLNDKFRSYENSFWYFSLTAKKSFVNTLKYFYWIVLELYNEQVNLHTNTRIFPRPNRTKNHFQLPVDLFNLQHYFWGQLANFIESSAVHSTTFWLFSIPQWIGTD